MIQQICFFFSKRSLREALAELKITTPSDMVAEMSGCSFVWEIHRLITGCSHTPRCWSVCWWSWCSRPHTPRAGPQIPQVNTPAAESCECLGCRARGDLLKHEQTPDDKEASLRRCCHKSVTRRQRKAWLVSKIVSLKNKRTLQSTIVSSSPGKYFSLIGHSHDVGSATWDLDQLISEERLDYLGLGTKTDRESVTGFKNLLQSVKTLILHYVEYLAVLQDSKRKKASFGFLTFEVHCQKVGRTIGIIQYVIQENEIK